LSIADDASEGGVQANYKGWARAIFHKADTNHNGQLTISELKTQLQGTEHQGFVDWLFFHRNAMFKELDKDKSNSVEVPEVARALRSFHAHVLADDTTPLEKERDDQTVSRLIMEQMYKGASKDRPPSFAGTFAHADDSGNGLISFSELEDLVREELRIPLRKLSVEKLKGFFKAIDRDGSKRIKRDEFVRFMCKQAELVSKCFVSYPAPHPGLGEDGSLYGGADAGRPPWMIPKTYDEMVKHCRTWHKIGGFSSVSTDGPTLPPKQPDLRALPDKPPLRDAHTVLSAELARGITFKERRENTAWDLSGPRYQITAKPLEAYHQGRVMGAKDGYYLPTRWGGQRVRHSKPLLLKGTPIGVDEARHAELQGKGAEEPPWLETLPQDTNVYERLMSVPTAARIHTLQARKEDLAGRRASTAQNKTRRYVPL